MSVSTADKVFLCVSLSGFAGVFVFLGIALHLAYTKMDMMLDHLKNCPAVMIRAPFKNGGPAGRLFVLGAIMGLMTVPRLYLRDGGASAEDLKSFPADLKRKLIVLHWGGCVPLLVLFGMVAVVEFGLV
ncbi:hypothetical protein QN400_00870 [Pseudomonas sp. RTC3]|uniref:hypothetical protein n=1 Tax=unclassified Pseudomonas TaxID=196821 RepID=UPI002AB40F3D|nr:MULTISPECIES: hypothetical protein [unclassified Pseudomonas]MDY7563567.1 hypothetical protein [Pseudomonas sp. 5C2]MEB0060587.1 hypothetical protein [Pseudomonas sp. RTC3]MEB0243562.1 hypothetical protein [Pseudomonas sp. 5C2]MEE3508384.1 hypothetical protein [Pseudomonas sp. 10C3]